MDQFVDRLLPAVQVPIVLVTGDSDSSPVKRHRALLADPRIAHWFAQNCDVPERHPRLTRIPIGLDNPVFNKLEKRLGFMLTMLLGRSPLDASALRNDMGDQEALQHVRAALPQPELRPLLALCTFHQNQKLVTPDLKGLPERAQAVRELAANPLCHFVPRRLRQKECWMMHGEFAFEVSPQGNGIDCFRTWEAMLLGSIPIVLHSTLDPLFEDEQLPVVVLDTWADVSYLNLSRWRDEHQQRLGSHVESVLRLGYWSAKIKKASLLAQKT